MKRAKTQTTGDREYAPRGREQKTDSKDARYKGHRTTDREQETAALEQKTRYRIQMNAARGYGTWDIGHGNSERQAEDTEQNKAVKIQDTVDREQWTDDREQWTNRTENKEQRMRTGGQGT